MASTNIYLNFKNQTEAAFTFYQSVFGGAFEGDGIGRMGDVPPQEGMPELSEQEKNLVMHVSLPILGGTKLMGTDVLESMGYNLMMGNNVIISLHPDTRTETEQLFDKLSEGGKVQMPLQEMFWGDYYGSCVDKFGVCWMFNCESKV
jgi:PhnB protein